MALNEHLRETKNTGLGEECTKRSSSRKTGRNFPLYKINKERRNIVTSGLHHDPCDARGSSSAPDASPAANEPVEDKHPR